MTYYIKLIIDCYSYSKILLMTILTNNDYIINDYSYKTILIKLLYNNYSLHYSIIAILIKLLYNNYSY